jgi:hypothetical protein
MYGFLLFCGVRPQIIGSGFTRFDFSIQQIPELLKQQMIFSCSSISKTASASRSLTLIGSVIPAPARIFCVPKLWQNILSNTT